MISPVAFLMALLRWTAGCMPRATRISRSFFGYSSLFAASIAGMVLCPCRTAMTIEILGIGFISILPIRERRSIKALLWKRGGKVARRDLPGSAPQEVGAPYLGGRVPGIDADVVVLVKSKSETPRTNVRCLSSLAFWTPENTSLRSQIGRA